MHGPQEIAAANERRPAGSNLKLSRGSARRALIGRRSRRFPSSTGRTIQRASDPADCARKHLVQFGSTLLLSITLAPMKKGHGRLARAIGRAGGKTAHLREKLRHRRFDDNSKWRYRGRQRSRHRLWRANLRQRHYRQAWSRLIGICSCQDAARLD
jgi:hypothetical protein